MWQDDWWFLPSGVITDFLAEDLFSFKIFSIGGQPKRAATNEVTSRLTGRRVFSFSRETKAISSRVAN